MTDFNTNVTAKGQVLALSGTGDPDGNRKACGNDGDLLHVRRN